MHVLAAALAAALALRGGVSAQPVQNSTLSPSLSPTVAQTFAPTLAPTLTVSPSFAPTGTPLCEPQCEYDYHLTSERMNKKILARVYNFCWILGGIVRRGAAGRGCRTWRSACRVRRRRAVFCSSSGRGGPPWC